MSVNNFVDNKMKRYVKSTSTSSNNKGKEKVKGKKKKIDNITNDVYIINLVVKISYLIEPPRDEDGKIQYNLMSLNTGIYNKGDDQSTAGRGKIVFIVMNFVLVLLMGVNMVGLQSGWEMRKEMSFSSEW